MTDDEKDKLFMLMFNTTDLALLRVALSHYRETVVAGQNNPGIEKIGARIRRLYKQLDI